MILKAFASLAGYDAAVARRRTPDDPRRPRGLAVAARVDPPDLSRRVFIGPNDAAILVWFSRHRRSKPVNGPLVDPTLHTASGDPGA